MLALFATNIFGCYYYTVKRVLFALVVACLFPINASSFYYKCEANLTQLPIPVLVVLLLGIPPSRCNIAEIL